MNNVISPFAPPIQTPASPATTPSSAPAAQDAAVEPKDSVLSGAGPIAQAEEPEEAEEHSSLATTVGTTAILVAGALSSLSGTIMPALQTFVAQPPPAISTTVNQNRPGVPQPVFPDTPEQASKDIHIISHMDATESIIEPFATNGLQQTQNATQRSNGRMTADVSIDREAHPYRKIATGVGHTGVVLAPFLVARHFAKKNDKKAILALALSLGGAFGSYQLASMTNYMHDGLGSIVSGVADLKSQEGVWSGNRDIHMEAGQRTVESSSDQSRPGDGKAISNYLAEHMKKYPQGTTVVHMMGHGLMYRHVSGLPGETFTQVLADATTQAGRPVDILVLESCLEGNLETLTATYPYARYAVVSEESISAGAVGRIFERTADATDSLEMTPRQLATEMLARARVNEGQETLALIDMQQIPQLNEAVDRLGADLVAEARAGRTDAIAQAVKDTPVYPKHDGVAKKLAVGDLKIFAENILKTYGEGGAMASSPNAAQVRADAQGVLDSLGKTVMGANMTAKYAQEGGLSIQLPGEQMQGLENSQVLGAKGMTSYKDAASPEHWREFVEVMSPYVK